MRLNDLSVHRHDRNIVVSSSIIVVLSSKSTISVTTSLGHKAEQEGISSAADRSGCNMSIGGKQHRGVEVVSVVDCEVGAGAGVEEETVEIEVNVFASGVLDEESAVLSSVVVVVGGIGDYQSIKSIQSNQLIQATARI